MAGNLTITGSAVKTHVAKFNANLTVSGTLSANGNSAINRLLLMSNALGTQRTLTVSGSVSGSSYVDFQDIRFSATQNLAAIAGGSGDCGGNSSITFTTSVTQNWTNSNGGSWSGAGNWTSRIPLPQDDVTFSCAFGSAKTVTVDMPRMGRSLDFSGATYTGAKPVLSFTAGGAYNVYGGCKLSANFTFTHNSTALRMWGRGAFNFTSAGLTLYDMGAYGAGGVLTLMDALTCAGSISIDGSGLTCGSYSVTAAAVLFRGSSSYATAIALNASTWTLTGASGAVWTASVVAGITFSAGTSVITASGAGSSSKTFDGGGLTYYDLVVATDNLTIVGSNGWHNFTVNTGGLANGLKLTGSTTQTISGAFAGNGSGGSLAKLASVSGVAALSKISGSTGSDYLDVTNVTAGGGAYWYGGLHSSHSGTVTGWIWHGPPTPVSCTTAVSVSATISLRVLPVVPGLQIRISEAGTGWVDRTSYLRVDSGASFSLGRGVRGTASFTLVVPSTSSYAPVQGTPQLLLDSGRCVFAGLIDAMETSWVGASAQRLIACSCVSLEKAYDSILIPPSTYTGTAGEVFTALISTYAATAPIGLGTISAGPQVVRAYAWTRLTDAFDSLAAEAGMIWFVRHSDQRVYMQAPEDTIAAFSLAETDVQWGTIRWAQRWGDFRTRQVVRGLFELFAPSCAVFTGDSKTLTFDLPYAADHITTAYTTTSTQAIALGTFSAQPAPGDTVTVNTSIYTFVATLDNREFGQVLIGADYSTTRDNLIDALNADPTTSGTTYSLPTWENDLVNASQATPATANTLLLTAKVPGADNSSIPLSTNCSTLLWSGATPTPAPSAPWPAAWLEFSYAQPSDGDTVTLNGRTYTFRTTINNSVADEISLGVFSGGWPDLTPYSYYALSNLMSAINGNTSVAGTGYSTPTTASTTYIASGYSGSGVPNFDGIFTGQTGIHFLLSAITTAPVSVYASNAARNQVVAVQQAVTGATTGTDVELTVSASGTDRSDVRYIPEQQRVALLTAPAAGTRLVILYYRLGADCVAVENSALVALRALLENGTGRYEQVYSDNTLASREAVLAKAQQILADNSELPEEFSFTTLRPGLLPAEVLNVTVLSPSGAGTFLNGSWLIEEIQAAWDMNQPSFRYGIRVDSVPVPNYLKLWENFLK